MTNRCHLQRSKATERPNHFHVFFHGWLRGWPYAHRTRGQKRQTRTSSMGENIQSCDATAVSLHFQKKGVKASPLPNGHIQVPILVLQAKERSFFHEICDTIIVGGRQEADLSLPNIWPSPPWKTCKPQALSELQITSVDPKQLGQIQRETCDLMQCRKKPGPKTTQLPMRTCLFFGWKILSTGPPVASNLIGQLEHIQLAVSVWL